VSVKISSAQLRGARGLLNWSRADLAKKANVSEQSIHRFENDASEAETRTQQKLLRAPNESGIELIEKDGVQFKARDVEIFEGATRFEEFSLLIHDHIKKNGGDICRIGAAAKETYRYRKDPSLHQGLMRDLQKGRTKPLMRLLLEEGDTFMPATDYAEYRWLKKEYFPATAFFVFGACVALFSFDGAKPPFVIVLKSAIFAEAYRRSFDFAWQQSKPPVLAKPIGSKWQKI